MRISPFWFKRHIPLVLAPQRNITLAQVQTPGAATSTDIIALYNLDDSKINQDPNTLGLYGAWTGTPEAYGAHNGILSDNGFSKYINNYGIQKNDWGAGTLDTYFNTTGITFSWISRPTVATGARLLQYWQADLEWIELYFLDAATIRLSAALGTATTVSDDMLLAGFDVDDGNFHHFVITFNPSTDRVVRFYADGVLAAETLAVGGAAVFGAEVANIRRGIGFGCSYTGTDADSSGDVDHCTILRGIFPPVATGLDNRMLHNGIFMKYQGGQMYYNLSAVPIGEAGLYSGQAGLYEGADVVYTNNVFVFRSGIPHWIAYD